MRTYWLKFTDGSQEYCDGTNAFDAVRIAEHLTKKTVDVKPENKYEPEKGETVKRLPYPHNGMIWQFEHPVFGKCPTFCYGGDECRGKSFCPKKPSCTS